MSRLLEALHSLSPEFCSRIPSAFYLTADSVAASLAAAGLKLDYTLVPDIDSGDWDDETLMELVFRDHWHFHKGRMLIHPPACSRHGLPDFECDAGALASFVRDFSLEMLFDGDVIFPAPASGTLTVFQHKGAFSHARL
ncbi:MAG: hypothetical protein EOP86_13670 [Verrucomicrobiaceae bacterium]|nr:MAG: hypothetical protein EOP86_13670 [Verrucomicrobiaceae bacterium]